MKKYKLLLTLYFLALFLFSCTTLRGPKFKDIQSDSVDIELSTNGEIIPVTGKKAKTGIEFSNLGQETYFKKNTPYRVTFQDLDFNRANLVTKIDDSDSVKVSVQDTYTYEVSIENVCDVYNMSGTAVPIINVKDGIPSEKIIIVPLFNSQNCEQIGWQVRYGEIERLKLRGSECTKTDMDKIQQAQKLFTKCAEKLHLSPRIREKSDEPKISLMEKFFGVKPKK